MIATWACWSLFLWVAMLIVSVCGWMSWCSARSYLRLREQEQRMWQEIDKVLG